MKLKIEVDVDWIGEESSVDEEVKRQIIKGVQREISAQCLKEIKDESIKDISEAARKASESLEAEVKNTLENWLDEKTEITDKWGDVTFEGSFRDLIKKKFDDALSDPVDSDGDFSNNRRRVNGTLIEYLTGKKVQEVVKEHLEGFNRDIDKQIKEHINAGIRENVSNKFAEMVIQTAKGNHAARPLEIES